MMALTAILGIGVLEYLCIQSGYAHTVLQGNTVILPCGNMTSNGTKDVTWCKKEAHGCDMVLSVIGNVSQAVYPPWDSARVVLSKENSLSISTASFGRDNGTFVCMFGADQAEVDLFVVVPPREITIHGPDNPVLENTNITLTCETVGGIPVPQLSWEIPKSAASEEVGLDTVTNTVSFVVTRNMNAFRCKATQFQYTMTRDTILEIVYPPRVHIDLSPAQYKTGDEVTLVCSSDGYPQPEIVWMWNGKLLATNDENVAENPGHIVDVNDHTSLEPVGGDEVDEPGIVAYGIRDAKEVTHATNTASSGHRKGVRLKKFPMAAAENGPKKLQRDAPFLKIHRIKSLDASSGGTYTCVSRNAYGHDDYSVTLKAKTPFEFHMEKLQPYLSLGIVGVLVVAGIMGGVCCITKRCRGRDQLRPSTEESADCIEMADLQDDEVTTTNESETTQSNVDLPRAESLSDDQDHDNTSDVSYETLGCISVDGSDSSPYQLPVQDDAD